MFHLRLQLVLSLVTYVSSTRVLDFSVAQSAPPGSPLSTALLTNVPDKSLPHRFVLCFSTKHTKIDNKSPFVIYGEDNKAWMAFSFWKYEVGVVLWVDVQGGSWTRLNLVSKPWTYVWLHICADIDTTSGNLSVSINGGETVQTAIQNLGTNKPDRVNIEAGLNMEDEYGTITSQFIGSVSNINIFKPNPSYNYGNVTSFHCLNGDFMDWSNLKLQQKGPNLTITEYEIACNPKDKYDILLPTTASWNEADHYCNILGHMTKVANEAELNNTAVLVEESLLQCAAIWVPISDEGEEGVFRNTYNGHPVKYLPWAQGQPNGGLDENFVGIFINKNYSFYDISNTKEICVSCTLKVTKTINLRGLCKGTKLGKQNGLT